MKLNPRAATFKSAALLNITSVILCFIFLKPNLAQNYLCVVHDHVEVEIFSKHIHLAENENQLLTSAFKCLEAELCLKEHHTHIDEICSLIESSTSAIFIPNPSSKRQLDHRPFLTDIHVFHSYTPAIPCLLFEKALRLHFESQVDNLNHIRTVVFLV